MGRMEKSGVKSEEMTGANDGLVGDGLSRWGECTSQWRNRRGDSNVELVEQIEHGLKAHLISFD